MGKTELLITIILFNLFFVLFLTAIMIYIKKYQSRKKEYLNELKIKNEMHQKEILSTQLEIQQVTMQQIGREIHDNVGQKLTLVSLYLQQFSHENKIPGTSEKIEQASQIINQSLQDLRGLSKSLTSDNITENGIITLIQEEADNINSLKKCKVSFEYDFENIELEFVQKNVLLRITQEFIQNSIKYSQCRNITINLSSSDELFLELILKDDGIGFDLNDVKSDGIGLKNMKKRTEIIGGKFQMKSQKNIGTEFKITLNQKQ